MSTMEPMYGIPAAIRYGVRAQLEWDDEETVASVFKEVRELINEHAAKLTTDEINENKENIKNMLDYLTNILAAFENMGVSLPDDEETIKKRDSLQSFGVHVMKELQGNIRRDCLEMTYVLNALRIAQEELQKYGNDNTLKSAPKMLKKVTE